MSIYHVWFSTKGRKPVLVEEIDELVKAVFREVAQGTFLGSIEIVELETALDHVHTLLDLKSGLELSNVMHDLKGTAARRVFQAFPELRLDMGSNSFWQKSYGVRLVPRQQLEIVRRYIRTQDERSLRHV